MLGIAARTSARAAVRAAVRAADRATSINQAGVAVACLNARKATLSDQKRSFSVLDPALLAPAVISVTGIASFVGFAVHRYKIAKPDEYLVRTGIGISDIAISKQGFQWPFQTYEFIHMRPKNYSFDLNSMSLEKLEFVLPGVFTIGPKDDIDSLKSYVKLLSGQEDRVTDHIDNLIKGILEGETRIRSAQMTIDEIFNDRKAFKDTLITNVQAELDQFGLYIYNANIKELQDTPGSEYFKYMRQKKRSDAENKAKVDVSEAKKFGDIGQKEREAETRQKVILIEADTVLKENERKKDIERSKADLSVVQSQASQTTSIAQIEAATNAKMREAELLKELEHRRIATEIERLRAQQVVAAQVGAEAQVKEAEGYANALKTRSEAERFAKEQEAQGIVAIYNAQSGGVKQLIESFNGDSDSLIRYLMLNGGLYEKLAKANADAIQGLNPKITVWTTGGDNDSTKPIADILKMVPPLVTTIHDQTGIKPGSWLMDMSGAVKKN